MENYPILKAQISPSKLDLSIGWLYQAGIENIGQKTLRGGKIELIAQIPQQADPQKIVEFLSSCDPKQNIFEKIEWISLKHEDWNAPATEALKPFWILKRPPLKVDPSGTLVPSSEILSLKASLAFGTGTHPTTALCAEALAEYLLAHPQTEGMDLGCGTAILALIAERLGAASVLAVDNDPVALQIAQENLPLNQSQKIVLDSKIPEKKWDWVVANLLLSTLLELKGVLSGSVKPGGRLIASGLLYRDCDPILEHYGPDFVLEKRRNRKGWSALELTRK